MERERGKETVSLLQKFVALANEIQESQSSSDPAPLRANDVPEPCPRPASPATGASQTPDSNSYTAEEYLSKAKVFTPAKKKFRHSLKRAAQECRVWGEKTLKQLTPGELRHIHKEVASRCPALATKQCEVEAVLSHCLCEAKYYRSRLKDRKEVKTITDKHLHKKTKTKKKHRKTGKGKKKERGTTKHHKTSTATSKSTCELSSNDEDSQNDSSSSCTDTSVSSADSDLEKKTRKGCRKRKVPSGGKTERKQISTKSISRRKLSQKDSHRDCFSSSQTIAPEDSDVESQSVMADVGTHAKTCKEAEFPYGTGVIVTDHGNDICNATFLKMENEIYAEIAFSTFCEGTGPTDVELPLPFEGKMTCSDLKKDDVFLWKLSKLRARKRNVKPNKRYM